MAIADDLRLPSRNSVPIGAERSTGSSGAKPEEKGDGREAAAPLPFPAGSVVQLRSGGQAMTVSGWERTDGLVSVEWFDGATLQRDAFDPSCLKPSVGAIGNFHAPAYRDASDAIVAAGAMTDVAKIGSGVAPSGSTWPPWSVTISG